AVEPHDAVGFATGGCRGGRHIEEVSVGDDPTEIETTNGAPARIAMIGPGAGRRGVGTEGGGEGAVVKLDFASGIYRNAPRVAVRSRRHDEGLYARPIRGIFIDRMLAAVADEKIAGSERTGTSGRGQR